jgi:hypothetical protein
MILRFQSVILWQERGDVNDKSAIKAAARNFLLSNFKEVAQ